MVAALYVVYTINCLFLILVVLLQAGRGGGLAGLGGGGGGAAVFGARGASTLLQKTTIGSAAGFMILSILIALVSSGQARTTRGVIEAPASAGSSEAPVSAPTQSSPASPVDDEQAEPEETVPGESPRADEEGGNALDRQAAEMEGDPSDSAGQGADPTGANEPAKKTNEPVEAPADEAPSAPGSGVGDGAAPAAE